MYSDHVFLELGADVFICYIFQNQDTLYIYCLAKNIQNVFFTHYTVCPYHVNLLKSSNPHKFFISLWNLATKSGG